jgi:predicted amidohydrolase YtcJ
MDIERELGSREPDSGPLRPTRRLIGAVTPDNPGFINWLGGHMCLANSQALKLAGVPRETPERARRDDRI